MYRHVGLTPETTYHYRMRYLTEDGPGEWTHPVAATTAPTNTPATGLPTITGTAQVGETLTVDTSGIADDDGLTNAEFAYQWIANDGSADSEMDGATGSTYTLVDADEGRTIRVRVIFTDDAGNEETLTSAATDAVAGRPPPPLTASLENPPGSHDGESAFTFELRFSEELSVSYQTLRDRAFTVSGGTVKNASRLVPGSNVGWRIEVRPDGDGDVTIILPATADCADTGAICAEDGRKLSSRLELTVSGPESQQQAVQNSPATGQPTISGPAQVGETLTARASDITDDDGLTETTFSYQWLADNADIGGATGSVYTLLDTDEGQTIKVRVSFTDEAGNEETLTSAATEVVAPKPNSPATGQPTISGTAQVGETLTADVFAITDDDGLADAVFSYQWLADDADLPGATGSAYTLVVDDMGKAISVTVTFTDDAGNEETLISAATEAVEAKPNTPATGAPTISGTARVGETLTADTSGIEDADGLTNATLSYQWVVNEASDDATGASYTVVVAEDGSATWVPIDGTADTDIEGATAPTYALTEADAGRPIRVRVSFTDDGGNSETVISAPTLMAGIAAAPSSHDGESVFTFELHFSEEFG